MLASVPCEPNGPQKAIISVFCIREFLKRVVLAARRFLRRELASRGQDGRLRQQPGVNDSRFVPSGGAVIQPEVVDFRLIFASSAIFSLDAANPASSHFFEDALAEWHQRKYDRASVGGVSALITPWCNGNTRDFGSLVQGSNPCGVACDPWAGRSSRRQPWDGYKKMCSALLEQASPSGEAFAQFLGLLANPVAQFRLRLLRDHADE
jgi:hypothetical protein